MSDRQAATGDDAPRASINVALVDDQPIVLAGVAAIIERESDLRVAATADDIEAAIRMIERVAPDVVISDIQLGSRSGLELLDHYPAGRPPIIMLSSFEHAAYYQGALQRGAAGYVLKGALVEQLVDAIRTVAGGGIAFPAQALRGARSSAHRRPTRRELEVVHQVAEGASNDEIAVRLAISPKTVDSHLRALFDKYSVMSRTELAMLAVSEGWLRPAPEGRATDASGRRPRWIADETILKTRAP